MNKQTDLSSPNLLVSVMDKIDTPAMVIDIAGKISFANAAMLRRMNHDLHAYIGTYFADISEGLEKEAFHRSHCTVTAGPYPLLGLVQPLFDDNKSLIGQVFFAQAPFAQTWTNLDELQDREMRWETAIESADQAVWDMWESKDQHFVSDNWFNLRGIAKTKNLPANHNWLDLVHPADLDAVKSAIQSEKRGETDEVNYQYRFKHGDGHWIWIQSSGRVVMRHPDGTPDRVIGTDTNITQFKKIEAQSKTQTERLRLAMEVSQIGLWHFQFDRGSVHWDDQMLDIYGISDGVHLRPKDEWTDTIHPDDLDRMLKYSEQCMATQSDFRQDYRIVRPTGEVRHIRSRARFMQDHNNEGAGFLGVNIDITEDVTKTLALEKARAAMEYESRHDPLTGLANRRKLDEVHAEIIRNAQRARSTPAFSVLHIDLDRFKEINDTHGHPAGDAVLVHVAQLIKSVIENKGLVARAGGDEFVVLLDGCHNDAALFAIANRMISLSQVPYPYDSDQLSFGMSIGIATHDSAQSNLAAAFVAADLALYQAKKDGRNCARHFDPKMREAAKSRRLSHQDIDRALSQGEFINFYQPQFCAKTRKLIGAETLVRWNSSEHGLVLPDLFLPAATACGLIGNIDATVLQCALTDLTAWDNQDLGLPRISVNISSSRLRDPTLAQQLSAIDIPKGRLCFELLETTFLEADDTVLSENLSLLRDLGIEIEIDDFGSGHASILGFLKIAPTRLKIDKALIAPITHSKAQRKIVAAIVEIAKLSNAEVIAEGIETEDHARIATAIGCDILQGYGLARPMGRDALTELLRASG